jgi:hypothetical protein
MSQLSGHPIDNLDHTNSLHPSSAPSTETNGTSNIESTKNTIANTAAQAMSAVQNHPATQQAKDTIVNGPVGQAVQNQGAKTSSEFQDLADARKTPAQSAATGQPLTHYHSLFYRLLSWKNPRATGIVFVSTVLFIFGSRYLNVLRYTLKGLYTILGVTALAEGVGKVTVGNGLASSFRPKQYYTIRKESLEAFLDDIEQLINFVVIEFQRILFVESLPITVAAFLTSFISYFLIKWLPLWGLSLIFTSVAFLAPLVYVNNKEFIDAHINHAGRVINDQATQVRDIAAQHTNQATSTIKSYAGEYSNKAQQIINDARGKATNGSAGNHASVPVVKTADFPTAPKTEPLTTTDRPITTTTNLEPTAVHY